MPHGTIQGNQVKGHFTQHILLHRRKTNYTMARATVKSLLGLQRWVSFFLYMFETGTEHMF